MNSLKITTSAPAAQVRELHCQGDIEDKNVSFFRETVKTILEDKIPNLNMCIDLTDIRYVDSTALGVLVGIKERLFESGGNISLVINSSRLKTVFRITGLDQLFDIYDNKADAIALLQNKNPNLSVA